MKNIQRTNSLPATLYTWPVITENTQKTPILYELCLISVVYSLT